MSDVWFTRLVPRPHARVRLFCLPNAGVGGSVYRLWASAMPETIEVQAVQLPGRETRFREPALRRIPAVVDGLCAALAGRLDRPFAFFGHSMGAVVASEVARALHARGAAQPSHLFVSAYRPPHLPALHPPIHTLSDAEFIAEIQRRYGGIPAAVLQEADLMALLLPGLRADIEALETHLPAARPPLTCPIAVFGGDRDGVTPLAHLEAWRGETTGPVRVRVFSGGHFYLDPCRAEVIADVAASLSSLSPRQS